MQMLMNMDGYDDSDVNGVPRAGNKTDTTYHVWDPRTNTVSISALLFAEKPYVWNISGMNQLRQFLQWVTVLRVLTLLRILLLQICFSFKDLVTTNGTGFEWWTNFFQVYESYIFLKRVLNSFFVGYRRHDMHSLFIFTTQMGTPQIVA